MAIRSPRSDSRLYVIVYSSFLSSVHSLHHMYTYYQQLILNYQKTLKALVLMIFLNSVSKGFILSSYKYTTKTGILLKRKQLSSLLDIFNCIDKNFATPKPIKCRELHQNQEDFMICPDCYPSRDSMTKKSKKRTTGALPVKKRLFDE